MTDIDLSLSPWDRLARLAPPGTNADDLQSAASRWSLTADVYNAAADLWEDKLMSIDMGPDVNEQDPSDYKTMGPITQIRQDGITLSFAVSTQSGNTQAARRSQAIQIRTIVRRLRARGKPHSPLVHSPKYNPWRNMPRCTCWCHSYVPDGMIPDDVALAECGCPCDTIIVVD